MNTIKVIQIVLLLACVHQIKSTIRKNDEVTLKEFNQTFYLANETYIMELTPFKQVPLNIVRYAIYTSSTKGLVQTAKRYLLESEAHDSNKRKRNLNPLSVEEFKIVKDVFGEDDEILTHFSFDRKRALEIPEQLPITGRHFIRLAEDVILTYDRKFDSMKREIFGTQICLAVPGVTQCDNTPSINQVRDALNAAVTEARTELDNIRSVTDARFLQLQNTLIKQNNLIQNLTSELQIIGNSIIRLSELVKLNSAEMIHGDNVLAANINGLRYTTDVLIMYANALGSTDPRNVVVQPALRELFIGYLTALDTLKMQGKIPIVSNTTAPGGYHNFSEVTLPTEAVRNSYKQTGAYAVPPAGFTGFTLNYNGLKIPIYGPVVLSQPLIAIDGTGAYQITVAFDGTQTKFNTTTGPYCISLFGYNVLTSFDFSSPLLANVQNIPHTNQDIHVCDSLRLTQNSSAFTYRYIIFHDGVLQPFYSNCQANELDPYITNGQFNYYSNYPDLVNLNFNSSDRFFFYDVDTRHYISPNCYINVLPSFIGISWYPPENTNISLSYIPYGYKTNHFVINAAGEISSNLEFLYTTEWIDVYNIQRRSQNNIIVNEIDNLQDSTVLFYVDEASVIDASDTFYGSGNNGRDCVQKQDIYDDTVVECFYQNDQKAYVTRDYLNGFLTTTGIARYNYKFNFTITQYNNGYLVTLLPIADADYFFYIDLKGDTCPSVVSKSVSQTGCSFTMVFNGTGTVTIDNATVPFISDVAVKSVGFGTHTISVDGKDCVLVSCQLINEISYVAIQTPNFQVISKDDYNVLGDLELMHNLNTTLQAINDVEEQVNLTNTQVANIAIALSLLNFNVSSEYQFHNFSEERALIDQLLAKLNETNGSPGIPIGPIILDLTTGCNSVFGGINCFLSDLAANLIMIAIVIGICILVYLLIFKWKVCSGKKKKK